MLDLRFVGQDDALTVPLDAAWLGDGDTLLAGARQRFVALHQQLYGYAVADGRLEVVTGRCSGVALVPRPPLRSDDRGVARPEPVRSRELVMPNSVVAVETPIYARGDIPPDSPIVGPAVVEEWTTTILVPEGWEATADAGGSLTLSDLSGAAA